MIYNDIYILHCVISPELYRISTVFDHRLIYHSATWAMPPPPLNCEKNCCYQISDFKAKMHQIRFPEPAGGAYSAPQTP